MVQIKRMESWLQKMCKVLIKAPKGSITIARKDGQPSKKTLKTSKPKCYLFKTFITTF